MMRNMLIGSAAAVAIWGIGLAFGDAKGLFYVGAMVGMVALTIIVTTVINHG